jgi:hypothetical protein
MRGFKSCGRASAHRLGRLRTQRRFVSPGFAARSGALIDKLGLDVRANLRAVAARRDVRGDRRAGPACHPHGIRQLTVSRTNQGAGFAERTRH